MSQRITHSHTVWVQAPREKVWAFTQDYSKRPLWDPGIRKAEVIAGSSPLRVRVHIKGGMNCEFQYKLFRAPEQTSLSMENSDSKLIEGGGGAWSYEEKDGGTLWTQDNSIVLRDSWFTKFMKPLIASGMRSNMKKSMEKAKRMMQSSAAK